MRSQIVHHLETQALLSASSLPIPRLSPKLHYHQLNTPTDQSTNAQQVRAGDRNSTVTEEYRHRLHTVTTSQDVNLTYKDCILYTCALGISCPKSEKI